MTIVHRNGIGGRCAHEPNEAKTLTWGQRLVSGARRLPYIGDAIIYHRDFKRVITSVKGVFGSYREARDHLPSAMGYDQSLILDVDDVPALTASRQDNTLRNYDEPIVNFISDKISRNTAVFNVGGNVGIEYYAYKARIPAIANTDWTICEIESVVERGTALARTRQEHNLQFTTDVSRGDGANIFLCVGTAQYLTEPVWVTLQRYKSLPKYVVLGYFPAGIMPRFYTVQNIGYSYAPYCIFSLSEVRESFEMLGYSLAVEWSTARPVRVPFHASRSISHFYTLIFSR
jgi:putative methyltransferase (TIGR04325 family)